MVKAVAEDLGGIAELVEYAERSRDFRRSPDASREEKQQIAGKLFSDRITGLTMQALRLMLTKGRETELLPLRDEFVTLRRAHEGVVYATISSAEALAKEQQSQIIS